MVVCDKVGLLINVVSRNKRSKLNLLRCFVTVCTSVFIEKVILVGIVWFYKVSCCVLFAQKQLRKYKKMLRVWVVFLVFLSFVVIV